MSPAGNQMPKPEGERAPTVLVVEDDVLLRLAASDHFRDAGLAAVEAANGEEAQSVLDAGVAIDLVFSDINMGDGIDGIALATWIAARYADIPVVITSGLQNALNEAQAECPQAKAFILKPYDYDALVRRVRGIIALRAKHT